VFRITGLSVHDGPDWPFKITGIRTLAAFVARMTAAGKPPKVILIAVARKLLVYAHAVIRTQKAFESSPDALLPA